MEAFLQDLLFPSTRAGGSRLCRVWISLWTGQSRERSTYYFFNSVNKLSRRLVKRKFSHDRGDTRILHTARTQCWCRHSVACKWGHKVLFSIAPCCNMLSLTFFFFHVTWHCVLSWWRNTAWLSIRNQCFSWTALFFLVCWVFTALLKLTIYSCFEKRLFYRRVKCWKVLINVSVSLPLLGRSSQCFSAKKGESMNSCFYALSFLEGLSRTLSRFSRATVLETAVF